MNPLWAAFDLPDAVHVVPVDDLVEHEFSADCPCGVVVEYQVDYAVPMISHSSLDGRELVHG